MIQEDVREKIQHLGKVNYLWHGAKRVPVSFVPFGVPLASSFSATHLYLASLLTHALAWPTVYFCKYHSHDKLLHIQGYQLSISSAFPVLLPKFCSKSGC